jgi:hypothetical protein
VSRTAFVRDGPLVQTTLQSVTKPPVGFTHGVTVNDGYLTTYFKSRYQELCDVCEGCHCPVAL